MMLIRVLGLRLIILLLQGISFANGQELDYSYTHYDKRDGLPSNKIYFMCSDRDGFLWLGTDAGLCRFNGHEFKVFTTKDGLPSNDVFQIFCDSKGRVWLTTMKNEVCFIEKDVVNNIKNNQALKRLRIKLNNYKYLEDDNGTIWVLTLPFTIYQIDASYNIKRIDKVYDYGFWCKSLKVGNGFNFVTDRTSLNYNFREKLFRNIKSLNTVSIVDLEAINDTILCVADSFNRLKLYKSNVNQFSFKSKKFTKTIFVLRNKVWRLTNNEAEVYDFKGLQLKKERVLLSNNSISSVCEDIIGNVWISTLSNGVFKINPPFIRNLGSKFIDGLATLNSILVYEHGIILGNSRGEILISGLNYYWGLKKIKVSESPSLSFRVLKILLVKGKLIICTDDGLYLHNLKDGITHCILPNQSCKNVYFNGSQIYVLNNASVRCMDLNGNTINEYYINERFYSYAEHNGKRIFGSERTIYELKDKLREVKIEGNFIHRCMDLLSKDSLLYVATADNGVYIIKDSVIVHHLNVSNGLSSNACTKMTSFEDDVFIATNNGICRYNVHKQSIFQIKESDGLASNNVNDITIYKDTLYAATDNGLSILSIRDFKGSQSFEFFISPISMHEDTLWGRRDSIFCHTDAKLETTLNALSFGIKGNVTFFYRIPELSKTFKSTNDSRVKVSLPAPGLYTFQAFAMDANQMKSKMAILNIVVKPYWWETNSFKGELLAMFLLIVGIVITYVNRFSSLREKIQHIKDQKIKRLELEAWKSNITPHFLFNSFNNIQSLFSSNQFEDANSFVSNFSGLLRKTIDNSSQLLNSFDEEVVYLTNYMQLERMKRNDKFSFSISVHDDLIRKYYLPSLILQPVIENSLKHGLNDTTDGYIGVNLKFVDDFIAVEIVDNGIGFSSDQYSEHTSKGIRMIRDKIRIVEGVFNKHIVFRSGNRFDSNGKIIGAYTEFLFPKLEQPGSREVTF